ncbi:MAG TPA: hypothetical protein VIJ14_09880, partial [Rhabdochlamydiaceae bacterium]
MSLLLRGIKGLGGVIYATPGAILRGGQSTLATVCAVPGAIKNTTVKVVSTLASGTLRVASSTGTAIKDTTVHLVSTAASGSWQATKWAATGAASGGWRMTKWAANGTVNLITAGKDATIAKSVQNYAELFFRIQNVGNKVFSELSGKLSLTQFNRNELAAKLEDLIERNAFAITDRGFVIRLCDDLRNPSVIFDKSREPELARLEKILPPDFRMPVSQANRNELAERLEEFIELYTLDAERKDFILYFCAELRDASVIFDKSKEVEMGYLEKILDPYFAQHLGYISSKTAEREQLEKLPGLTTLAPPKLTPAETLDGIQEQVDLLKSNSIKLVLGSIILNMTMGMYTFEGIDFDALEIDCKALGIAPPQGEKTNLINFLIEVSNKAVIKGKSSEEAFMDLIYRVIDNSGKNIFTRIQAKMRCGYLFGLVSNLIGNLFDNLKATLVHFAKLPPAQQLEEITKLLINPLLEHLSAVDGSQPAAPAGANPTAPRTTDEILDQFIETFLAQFLDRKYQPWTRTFRTLFIEKAYHSGPIAKAFYITLATLLWVVGKIIAPVQWALNETIHRLLKKVIVGLVPSLSNVTKSSLDIGTDNAWYSLKNSLLLMLQQVRLTGLLPRAEDPIFQPPKKLPAEVKEKLATALDKLFKVLAIPEKSKPALSTLPVTDPAEVESAFSTLCSAVKLIVRHGIISDADVAEEELRKFLATDGKGLTTFLQKNMHGKGLGWLKDIIKTAVTELTLDMVAQDGFISETLLSSLSSTNANGFPVSNVPVSTAEKYRVDVELQQELGLLGGTILQAVNDASRTDRSYQTFANTHITEIKQHVHALNEHLLQLQKTPELPFKNRALEACARFAGSMINLRTKITETVDAPTQALLRPHIDKALEDVLKISEKLNEAHPTEVLRKQVEAKLDELYPLLEIPLDNQEKIDQ